MRNKSTGLWRLYALWFNLLGVSNEAVSLDGGLRCNNGAGAASRETNCDCLHYQGPGEGGRGRGGEGGG